jgi:hypothetical protein
VSPNKWAAAALVALLSSASTTVAQPSPEPDDGLAAAPPRRAATAPELSTGTQERTESRPQAPPLHIDYASYGVAVSGDVLADAGATCREIPGQAAAPCILGSGGGLVLRGGYRSPGPWYIGGAYQFSKTDSSNLYRLGILQQLRGEMRYMLNMGYRTSPYATWGVGGVVYGNEWGVETGGATIFGGVGLELQLSRVIVLGAAMYYQPVVFAGWTDTANFERDPGLAQYMRIELQLELRSELTRR